MNDPFGGLIGFALAVGLGWVFPIHYGIANAKRKGYSCQWMWFGIYPLTGWSAWLILTCLPYRNRCTSCGGYVGSHFRICPYCHNDPSPVSAYPAAVAYPPLKFADPMPELASPRPRRYTLAILAGVLPAAAIVTMAVIVTIVASLGQNVSSEISGSPSHPGTAPARPSPHANAESTKPYMIERGALVVTKVQTPLTVGNQVVDDDSSHRIYTVEEVNGPWLWVVSGGISGWLPTNQVVPFDQAIDYYTGKIRDNPSDSDNHLGRARIWMDKCEYDIAINDLSEAIRLNPKSASAYGNRGTCWKAKGQFDRSMADYNEVIRLDPTRVLAYYNRGDLWHQLLEDDRALTDYDSAIRIDPKYAPTYYNRGYIWQKKQEYDQAIADFSEAIRLDSKYAAPYGNRGCCWRAKGQDDRAMADFSEAIRLDPSEAPAWVYCNRGNLWAEKQDNDRALADYGEAIRLDPKYALSYINRGQILYQQQDLERSLADLDEAIRLDPKNAQAYHKRGCVQYQKRDYDRALADYDEAIRLDPASVLPIVCRARIWATSHAPQCRDAKRALEFATHACELTGWKEAYSIDTYAAACAKAGYFDVAVKWQERALEFLGKDDPERVNLETRKVMYQAKKPYRE
jgi:tetratricopeptide (TPR) repeat protein